MNTAPHPAPSFVLAGLVGGACALPALASEGSGDAAASVYLLLAVALSVLAPAWAREGAGGASTRAAVCVGAGGVLGALGPGVRPLALLWLLLFAAALVGLTRLARGARGQALGTAVGLGLLAWPYLGLSGALPADAALAAAVRSPLAVLCGSFADLDVLRAALYTEFEAVQETPYSYLSPAVALGWAAAAAGLAWLLAGVAALWRRSGRALPAPRAAAVVALLACAAAAPSQGQEIFTPSPRGGVGPQIGDLTTRVQLGYFVPDLAGYVRVDGNNGQRSNRFSFRRTIDLDPLYVLPTFEVSLGWQNGGRLWVQYFEARWNGETQTANSLFFEEQVIPAQSFIDSRYAYRTIAAGGELHIPLAEWALLRITTIQRYVKHEFRVRAFSSQRTFVSSRDSLETFVPTIGGGVDIFAWGVVTVYGNMQWLDFRTSLFGGEDGKYEVAYREWSAGVRLELIEHAHIMGEWFSLEHTFRRGDSSQRETYRTELNGVRIQVAILF
ncbi:MAG: hypothetical protein R3F62_22495 [Planctomycetota bacterium]